MTKPVHTDQPCVTLICAVTTGPATYSLTQAAAIGGVHPELLRHYDQIGLFTRGPTREGAELGFDDNDLYELRRFEHYRRQHGVSRRTLRVWCALWREIQQLKSEVRFLRRI
jgi:DNA-binding transcriptional MerR regulator